MIRVLETLAHADLRRTRAGARHVLHVPVIRALASDLRLADMAARFVGPKPVAFRATLFEKSRTNNWLVGWHQDKTLPLRSRNNQSEWGPWSLKSGVLHAQAPSWALETVVALRVHLDDSTTQNGPLRVIPGTHAGGVLTDEEIPRIARDATAVDCVVPAGGVVAMRPLLLHASTKASDGNPRRVLQIEYAAAIRLRPGVELAVG
jgi:hypothetical protein